MPRRLWDLYAAPWSNYADVDGRATIPEFWFFVLVNTAIAAGMQWLDRQVGIQTADGTLGLLDAVFALVTLVPTLTVTARRLHDGNRRGWWILAYLIPIAGFFIALYQLLGPGTRGENRFGPDPRGVAVVNQPMDGGPPFATRHGRYIRCPWCQQSNPVGTESCPWCHKPYREPASSGPA